MAVTPEFDWRAEYETACGHADGLADLVRAVHTRTVDAIDWVMSVPERLRDYDEWKARRPPIPHR